MVIISRDAVLGSSIKFFSISKPTIVPVIRHFLTSAKFHKIPQQYQNSAEKNKFCDLARNSAARGKLWTLPITIWYIYTNRQFCSFQLKLS